MGQVAALCSFPRELCIVFVNSGVLAWMPHKDGSKLLGHAFSLGLYADAKMRIERLLLLSMLAL